MAVSAECIAAVRAASGDTLTDAEATALIRRMEGKRAALRAAGNIDNLDARLRAAASEDATSAQIAARIARKQAALTAIAYDSALRHVETLRAAGLDRRQGLLAFAEGTTKLATGGRDSIAATGLAYRGRYMEPFNLAMVRNPEAARLVQNGDRGFSQAVVREMRELRPDGQPGITGNRDAQALAKIYSDISTSLIRTDLNRMGATIGKLDGWSPQAHDAARVAKASFEEWRDVLLPRLDTARTFGDMPPERIDNMLRGIHTEIITGVQREASAAEQGVRTGPANLANTLSHSRTLHYQDAAAWNQYAERFGTPDIHAAMLQHIHHASRMAAQMEKLGPNPTATWNMLRANLQREAANDPALTAQRRASLSRSLDPNNRSGTLTSAWAEFSGVTSSPGNLRWAEIGTTVRAVQSMAKLGGAVISSATDLATRQSALIYQGMPIGRAISENVGELLRARGAGELREIAAVLDAGLDGIKGHITAAGMAEDMPLGRLNRLTNLAFKWQGMTWWQDAQKAGAARMVARWMGDQADTAWESLAARYTNTLRQHGIGAAEWDVFRSLARQAEDGNRYVTPDLVREIPREEMLRIAKPEIDAMRSRSAERKPNWQSRVDRVVDEKYTSLEITLRRFFADEMGFAYLETDAASRRIALQGTQAGTVTGEAARFLMQFKGFPIAFTQRQLGRALQGYSAEERLLQGRNLGVMIAGLTVLGIASMTVKDLVRGYGPRDFTKPATWLAAMQQAGGLGIYGDFLFSQSSRFGNSALETLAGPTASTAASAINLYLKARDGDAKAGDAMNLALQNTPFVNLWWTKPALDLLILNSLRETVSPGFLQRQHKRRFDDFGQRPLSATYNAFQ